MEYFWIGIQFGLGLLTVGVLALIIVPIAIELEYWLEDKLFK